MKGRVEFKVKGDLPPKKDGAKSMWAKRAEIPRLIALRLAALKAMAGRPPFRSSIELELELHCSVLPGRRIGDLDTFITGVCDGLMAAVPQFEKDQRWEAKELADIHPSKIVAIEDDSAIVLITARKMAETGQPWYRVSLLGE